MAGAMQSMQYTMPIMFAFMSLQFQAGLSVYWVLSNLIGVGQGFYMRRAMALEKERREQEKLMAPTPIPPPQEIPAEVTPKKKKSGQGKKSKSSKRKKMR
jgi:membrane protein insertase Oxa1/YidC/SpoIIIJ